jgi:hypothetical protein
MNGMKTSQTSLSSLVVEFHKLAHEFQKPEYLEIAGLLGKVKPDTFDWEKKVNEGCDKQGIPHIYPKLINTPPPHPLPEVVR